MSGNEGPDTKSGNESGNASGNARPRGDGVFKVRESRGGAGYLEKMIQVRADTAGEYRRFTQVGGDGCVERIVFERV